MCTKKLAFCANVRGAQGPSIDTLSVFGTGPNYSNQNDITYFRHMKCITQFTKSNARFNYNTSILDYDFATFARFIAKTLPCLDAEPSS